LPLPQARGSAGAAALNGLAYVAGGIVPAGGGNSRGKSSATMIVYDPAQNTWHSAAPMNGPRQALRLVAADGNLYAIGGMDRGPSLSTVERYNPNADSWQTMSPMHESRVRPSVVYTRIGSKRLLIVVAGVEFSQGGNIVDGRRTTEIFDLDTGEWELLDTLLPKVRGSHGGAIEPDGSILAIGGGTLDDGAIVFLADVDALTLRRRDPS
jgi:N-acetylneuraminic acid mutarotase